MSDDEEMIFWERVAEMPPWEAEQELVSRKHDATRRREAALAAQGKARKWRNEPEIRRWGTEVDSINRLLGKLNDRITYLRKLQDRMQWKHAVIALYGQDAYNDCVMWIEQHYGEQTEQRRKWAAMARAKEAA